METRLDLVLCSDLAGVGFVWVESEMMTKAPFPVVGEPVVDEESMVVVGERFSIPRLMSSLVRGVGAAVVLYFGHYASYWMTSSMIVECDLVVVVVVEERGSTVDLAFSEVVVVAGDYWLAYSMFHTLVLYCVLVGVVAVRLIYLVK